MGQQGRYIGRVGALAVALGIGGFLAALPAVADADTGAGDSGKTTSSAGKPAPRHSAKPAPRAQKSAAKSTGTVSAVSRVALDRVGSGSPLAPVTEPLSWAVLAVARREKIAGSARLVSAVPSTTTSAPAAGETGDVPPAAGATASPALATAVRNFIDTHLPGWSAIADELSPIVADGVQDLLDNGAISAEVQRLVTNTAIHQFVSAKISTALHAYLGVPTAVGTVVGNAAVNLATTVLGNAGVQTALDALANSLQPDSAQRTAITTALNGGDLAPLKSYLKGLVSSSSSNEIAVFLSDPAVASALASGVAQAVVDLTSGGTIPTWLGDITAGWISESLGDTAAASAIGDAVGNAVQGLLSNTKAVQALGTVASGAVTNILGAPGVPAALADFLTTFGTGVVDDVNWLDALDTAWQGLIGDSSFRAALGPAAGDAVSALVGNADLVAALAATTKQLVIDLAASSDVRTLIGEMFGPTYGPTIVSTLADPTSAAQLGVTAGAVITNFLGQAGVAAALSAAAEQIITDLLSGYSLGDAIMTAFGSLQADPAVVAAFNATVPDALKDVLKAPAVRDVIGDVAQGVVAELLDQTPINGSFLDPVASQVTKVAVQAFIANPVAQGLIGDLAGEILDGTQPTDLVTTVVQKVVTSPALQIALGQALGQGFGALLGDNPIAYAVGQLAGVGTAAFLLFAFGAANLFGLTGGLSAAAVPSGSSYLLIPVSIT